MVGRSSEKIKQKKLSILSQALKFPSWSPQAMPQCSRKVYDGSHSTVFFPVQAPPLTLGVLDQSVSCEHFSSPIPIVCVLSCSVEFDSLQLHGLYPATVLCPWDFPRQEYWSGLPFPSPGNLPDSGTEPCLLLGKQILYHWAITQGLTHTLVAPWLQCHLVMLDFIIF